MPTLPIGSASLPIQQIHPNPDQPRKIFLPEALLALKDSMKARGLIHPISVKKQGEDAYLIMAGERRYRMACELGWPKIDARIWPAETTAEEAEIISLVENLQRANLNPIEIAKGYKVLASPPHNKTHEEIAREVGIADRTIVTRMLSLLEQPDEIQQIVSQDTISLTHLRYLDRLQDVHERIKMCKEAALQGWSVLETEKRVKQALENSAIMQAPPKPAVTAPAFHFSRKDGAILIKATFPGQYGPATMAEEMQSALSDWLTTHPLIEKETHPV